MRTTIGIAFRNSIRTNWKSLNLKAIKIQVLESPLRIYKDVLYIFFLWNLSCACNIKNRYILFNWFCSYLTLLKFITFFLNKSFTSLLTDFQRLHIGPYAPLSIAFKSSKGLRVYFRILDLYIYTKPVSRPHISLQTELDWTLLRPSFENVLITFC
jgi:hypothetical protein